MTADAPSSGSRVRLCSLHHVTPADGAPRCCKSCMCCVFFRDHRLSISGCKRRDSQCRSLDSRCSLGMTALPSNANAPPGSWRRWGVSNRSDPMTEAMRYGASPRYSDPAPRCPASSDRKPNPLVLLYVTSIAGCFRSLGWFIREPRMPRAASIDHCASVHLAPRGAHQLPASRCSPACRGATVWSCVSVVM